MRQSVRNPGFRPPALVLVFPWLSPAAVYKLLKLKLTLSQCQLFAEAWNGVSMFWDTSILQPQFILFSDASGCWGCGACWGNQWFHLRWPVNNQILSIAVKELIPVITAAALVGHQWRGHLIQLLVHNMSVFNSTYCRGPHLMHLVFLAVHFDFWFRAQHIEGKRNNFADALSRNNVPLFKSHFSQTIHP